MTIKIILAGPRGKMGREAIQMIQDEQNFELIACIDRKNDGKTLKEIDGMPNMDVPVYENPKVCFQEQEADVFLDLTIPEIGFLHAKMALEHNVRPVVGTSGLSQDQIEELRVTAEEKKLGSIIAPNFAIGAILMMKFAKKAAAYFNHVEIIEKHHDQKIDAPSGTAMKTIEMIQKVRKPLQQGHQNEYETVKGSRGGSIEGIHIHSVRLPGLVAHQEVIFGGPGEILKISHDSMDRKSFMQGIKFSIHQVLGLKELVYGLENLIDEL